MPVCGGKLHNPRAPEKIRAKITRFGSHTGHTNETPQADVFSTGALFYERVRGLLGLDGIDFQIVDFRFRISIAVEEYGEELNGHGDGEPDLPVGEDAGADGEGARESKVRAEPPHAENKSHKGGGGEERGGNKGEAAILPRNSVTFFPDPGTGLKSNPDSHYSYNLSLPVLIDFTNRGHIKICVKSRPR